LIRCGYGCGADAIQAKEFNENDWEFQTTVDGMVEEVKEDKSGDLKKDETKKRGFLRKVLHAMQKK
jgi:hypothetical protein